MCVYSMVTDHFIDKWRPFFPDPAPGYPAVPKDIGGVGGGLPYNVSITTVPQLTAEEVAQIRRDVVELRALLERAREYDKRNNEPDCELAEKRKLIVSLATALGLDVSFV